MTSPIIIRGRAVRIYFLEVVHGADGAVVKTINSNPVCPHAISTILPPARVLLNCLPIKINVCGNISDRAKHLPLYPITFRSNDRERPGKRK